MKVFLVAAVILLLLVGLVVGLGFLAIPVLLALWGVRWFLRISS